MNLFRIVAGFSLMLSGAVCLSAASPTQVASVALACLGSPWPLVIGHRGFSKRAPENTLPSFRMGWEAGADLVELDYYHSQDGVPVVIHDGTLDRTTDAAKRWGQEKIAVTSKTVAELQELDAGVWFNRDFAGTKLPTLAEVLRSIPADGLLLIERKGGDPATLLELLKRTSRRQQVVVQAFDWDFLRGCHDLAPDLPLGALGPPSSWQGHRLSHAEKVLSAKWIEVIAATGAKVIGWNDQVDARSVALAHERGLQVWVYTIDDPQPAAELVGQGVDGIITNDPETIRKRIAPRYPARGSDAFARSLPKPMIDHPGNIFLAGEFVRLRVPDTVPAGEWEWRLKDDQAQVVQTGTVSNGAGAEKGFVDLGTLGTGWYRLEFEATSGATSQWTSLAVLTRLAAPVPEDSPVCLDSAAAWFARDDVAQQERLTSLAALAGVNWIRDRLKWKEVEFAPGQFAARSTYDTAADVQSQWGLKVLQVFHDTPAWARTDGESGGHFARDLRTVHDFCAAMARRFHRRVFAWEPWNEANVKTFGSQTVDEMCSWQKAAWLGFKRGDPTVLVGWNPTAAVPTQPHTDGIIANEASNYFDTYNYHTYDWPHSYLNLWEPARAAAGGRPIWITESDRGMKHENNPPWFDLSPDGERLKAELMAQEYAQSLYAGASRHFHFILGQYQEPNGVQFGLLRTDLTPRPAYVALAAVGRFLAGATCLGRWQPAPDVHVIAFRAQPDGQAQDVLVMWAEREVDWPERGKAKASWPLPKDVSVKAVYDYLGRPLKTGSLTKLRSAPVFVLLPPDGSRKLPLEPPPSLPQTKAQPTQPSSIVLQTMFPPTLRKRVEDKPWSEAYAWSYRSDQPTEFELAVYNFGTSAAEGKIKLEQAPSGWTVTPDHWQAAVAPGERKTVTATLTVTSGSDKSTKEGWVRLRGGFGKAGRPVVAFRMVER